MEPPTPSRSIPHWPPPSLTTADPDAVLLYQEGINDLVAGGAHARSLLGDAVGLDPTFTLAGVALAVADAVAGARFTPPAVTTGLSRGERQHVEVVRASFSEDLRHARDLRREHLAEFPGDLLVVWLRPLGRDPK